MNFHGCTLAFFYSAKLSTLKPEYVYVYMIYGHICLLQQIVMGHVMPLHKYVHVIVVKGLIIPHPSKYLWWVRFSP